ncbi:FAD-dependent thymidylate synthase [Corynebacterium variabile]|uniref:FAD-dependent thymidylate synthase n=1 Tax=Corynebacterium variabile TaxID=1727 RepID=UPI00289E091C|nr:FAD-dependent thymidylate synthase [Corynebacterium variabile]
MNIVTPKIELIASTTLTNTVEGGPKIEDWMSLDPDATDAECLVEEAGRGCYESWDKPNPKTARNADYISRTAFEMQHGSILEHASATFRFSGVSRAWLMEMERHRHLSWSVVSQRYVDAATFGVVIPPAIREETGSIAYHSALEGPASEALEWWSGDAMWHYEVLAHRLHSEGLPRKQAREAARSVLPNCTEVRGVVTGNLRAWSTILPLRAHPSADREMQEVSMLILDALEPVAPTVVNHLRYQIAYPGKETA